MCLVIKARDGYTSACTQLLKTRRLRYVLQTRDQVSEDDKVPNGAWSLSMASARDTAPQADSILW